MFLWVVLVMQELEKRDERLSDEVIASKLSQIPLTIIKMYESMLQSIPSTRKQDMWRIFRWLLYGCRNLTLPELEKALCLETEVPNWHDFDGDLEYLCGSFIRLDAPRGEINFVHQTARGFLEQMARLSNAVDIGELDMAAKAANEHLAVICVNYLLEDEMLLEFDSIVRRPQTYSSYIRTIRNFHDRYPFLHYAIEGWAFHLGAVGTPSSTTSTLTRNLLDAQATRDSIMAFTFFLRKQENWSVPIGQTPLHLAAYFNIPWLAQIYISENMSSVHATSGMEDTPLIWASEMGSTEVGKLLLDAGANPNKLEIDGWSALHWAARNGHFDVAKLLLEHGARLSNLDRYRQTPLDWAFDREHWDVVGLFNQWIDKNDPGRLAMYTGQQGLKKDTIIERGTRYTRQLRDPRS